MLSKTLHYTLLAAVLAAGGGLAACDKPNSGEKAIENVKDGLNMRENEKLKDAGEDAADAMKGAGEAIEDKAGEIKEDVQK